MLLETPFQAGPERRRLPCFLDKFRKSALVDRIEANDHGGVAVVVVGREDLWFAQQLVVCHA